MRKTLLVILFLQIFATGYSQSIIVSGTGMPETNYGAEQLLTDVLLDGGICSSISDFQLKDNPSAQFPSLDRSWGYFEKGNSNFPFERGVVLTSGYAINAEGPDDGIQSDGTDAWTGDADASILAQFSTYNATVFEFDFTPQGNEISFNYIFASEEYPDFVCQEYNDVFAFIISGPGIVNDPGLDGKNIALLPNGEFVSINNVNDQSCGDDTYYVGGPFAAIEHGGRTTPLTAYSQVVPGETYHIRLLIADSFDSQYDSAVFLEAGSFNLGSTIVDETGVDLGENLTVCGSEPYTLHVNVEDPSVQLQWYQNDEPIDGAITNQLVITESAVYKIEVISGDCTATDEIDVEFVNLATNGTEFELEEIDQGGDGVENFNLTEIQNDVVDDPAGLTFRYYETLVNAENEQSQINNTTSYPAEDGTIVYLRIENAEGCFQIVEVTLRLVEDCINPQPVCPGDDYGLNIPFLNDGEIPVEAPPGPEYDCLGSQPYPRFFYFQSATDGSLNFYLNQYTEEDQEGEGIDVDFIVWGPFEEVPCNYEDLQDVVSCSFLPDYEEYVTVPNAQAGEIYVMMVTNYAGTFGQFGYVNLIFDEQNSTGTFDCSILADYSDCDNDGDGQVQFDLNAIATDLAEGDATLDITFYSTLEDAENDTGNNILSSPYTVLTSAGEATIYGQIKNANGAIVDVANITLIVFEGVTGAQDVNDFICDAGSDGTEVVNLTSYDVIDNPSDYTITYYETEQDAIDGNASFIPNPASYEIGTGTVFVRIENGNGCFTVVEINIEVTGLEVDLGEDFSMCVGEFTLTAGGDFSEYTDVTFTWERNGQVIDGATTNTLVINEIGNYQVTVNTAEGCSGSDNVIVTQGESPTITSVTVGPDNVIIEATGGVEPYQYSITGVVWQDSNQFDYLQPGTYTVYVRTAEGCIASQEFVIFQIPTMFTPNGDGINDTWNIRGFDIYEGSNIVIYDRYGRLVHEAVISSEVMWDGFFMNGQKAPTQDYWYIINVSDGRKFTGHITVKSRGEKN